MSNMFMTWQSCIMNTEQTSENVFTHRNHLFCNDVLPKFNAFLKQASCWKIKMLTKCIDNMTPENYFHPYQPKVWSWKWSCLNLWKKNVYMFTDDLHVVPLFNLLVYFLHIFSCRLPKKQTYIFSDDFRGNRS